MFNLSVFVNRFHNNILLRLVILVFIPECVDDKTHFSIKKKQLHNLCPAKNVMTFICGECVDIFTLCNTIQIGNVLQLQNKGSLIGMCHCELLTQGFCVISISSTVHKAQPCFILYFLNFLYRKAQITCPMISSECNKSSYSSLYIDRLN